MIALIEPVALGILLLCIGLLSRRMGSASDAPPRYQPFFVGAGLMALCFGLRMVDLLLGLAAPDEAAADLFWVMVYRGLPAAAVTLGLIGAWRYWSWLLAERA
ncbi:MAG: hypothetical protein CUN53_06530 [Phototrophicales bacterium]|nr:MAG: hypothetical protein CUN53_06530 [Phototrophicales bacterium]